MNNAIQVDRVALEEVLENFFSLTHIHVTFWDYDMKCVIGASGHSNSDFCVSLQRHAGLLNRCKNCEQEELEAATHSGRLHCFHCHAGMNEFIVPVLYENRVLGCFMYGQSRLKEYPDDKSARISIYQEFHLDMEDLERKYAKLPLRTYEFMESAGRMLETLAKYAFLSEIIKAQNLSLTERIQNYIQRNYATRITVQTMCDALYVSRSTVCHVLHRELHTTFTDLLTATRLKKVRELLATPVSIDCIANETGYLSANYMSRVFKRCEGMTPSQYRKMVMGGKGKA